jgi:hypothetical protein
MADLDIGNVLLFLAQVKARGFKYRLSQSRASAITVEIFLMRERWEIDLFEDGTIEVDRFVASQDPHEVFDLTEVLTLLVDEE